MRFFLDDLGQIRAIEVEQEYLIGDSWEEVQEENLNILLNPPKTPEQLLLEKVQEAKDYLVNTDFKMTVDYYATLTEQEQQLLVNKRAEAREFVRINDVHNP